MEEVKHTGTRRKILEAAIKLFSENGFSAVATRDIAKAVDIQASSLYSHFASKRDILEAIYDFYEERAERSREDIEAYYKLAETADPIEVLTKAQYFFEPEDQEYMDRTIVIAALENRNDERSEEFLVKNLIEIPFEWERKLLQRLVDLGRIEPLDIETFCMLMSNFCYSAAVRQFTGHQVTMDEWIKGCELLYSNIVPTGK